MASLGLRALDPNLDPSWPDGSVPAELRRREEEERRRAFLRMVSHELRTPLNSIIGFSEIIACELYGPLSEPRYREHAEIVRDSGLKLLKLVNQVLEIARLESGAADLDISPEPVAAALEEVLGALQGEADVRGVRFRVAAEPDLPPAMADARALKTVLTNLIQNAIAFSPEGGEVAIGLAHRNGMVRIEIRDSGEGVDSAEIPRLMRPFEQGESPLTRRSEGAGLGLPIARLLCGAMKGGLRLKSAPGQGMTALVGLPAAHPLRPESDRAPA